MPCLRTSAVTLLALAALTACAAEGADPPVPEGGGAPLAQAQGEQALPMPPRPLTLAFAGDVHFERRVRPRLDAPDEPLFGPITEQIREADLAVVNLETAITERGHSQPKTYTFRAPPSALDVLSDAGVDVVSLANNHAVDFGAAGLEDTLAAAGTSPVAVVGLGKDAAAAHEPHVVDVRGTTIAVLGASQVRDHTLQAWTADADSPGIAAADSEELIAAVRSAAANAEVVAVYVHWGRERERCPSPGQEQLAAALAGAGADVVVGTHAHRLQGAGWLDDTYVAYGLGNFLWYSSNSPTADRTGVLTVTLRDDEAVTAELTPADIDERGVPVPLAGKERDDAIAAFDELRGCAGLAPAPPGGR